MNSAKNEEPTQRSKLSGTKRKHKEVQFAFKKIEKAGQNGTGSPTKDGQQTIDNMLKKMVKTEVISSDTEEIKEKQSKKRNPNKKKEP